jgi:DNA-binding NarL/FixJ family response regulator
MDSSRQLTSNLSLGVLESLTPRERDVLAWLAAGLCNREIAKHLELSEKTVRNRISDIFGKIGASNRTQAALWAHEHGFKRDWLFLTDVHQNRDICP